VIDDLQRLATFALVVEAGGFAAAARQIGVSRAAVSHQIATLEARYETKLLHRTTRRVAVTDAGAALLSEVRGLPHLAERARQVLAGASSKPSGTLTVSAPFGLAEYFLAERLAAFLDQNPAVRARVRFDDTVVNLIEDGVDVAIRAGTLSDSALTCRKLHTLSLMLVASAGYAEEHGLPETPEALPDHAWLGYTPLGDPQRLVLTRGAEQVRVRLGGRVASNHGPFLLQLALGGGGVTLLPRFQVEPQLTDGSLVEVLAGWRLPEGGVYAVFQASPHIPAKVRAFVDHLSGR
jgi:DNA-binding transcriptional LysR family regulator